MIFPLPYFNRTKPDQFEKSQFKPPIRVFELLQKAQTDEWEVLERFRTSLMMLSSPILIFNLSKCYFYVKKVYETVSDF